MIADMSQIFKNVNRMLEKPVVDHTYDLTKGTLKKGFDVSKHVAGRVYDDLDIDNYTFANVILLIMIIQLLRQWKSKSVLNAIVDTAENIVRIFKYFGLICSTVIVLIVTLCCNSVLPYFFKTLGEGIKSIAKASVGFIKFVKWFVTNPKEALSWLSSQLSKLFENVHYIVDYLFTSNGGSNLNGAQTAQQNHVENLINVNVGDDPYTVAAAEQYSIGSPPSQVNEKQDPVALEHRSVDLARLSGHSMHSSTDLQPDFILQLQRNA